MIFLRSALLSDLRDIFLYRNKLEYTFSDKRWLTKEEVVSDNKYEKENALGFHIPGLFDKVLDIEECHLQPEPSNSIKNAVRKYAQENGLQFFDLQGTKRISQEYSDQELS